MGNDLILFKSEWEARSTITCEIFRCDGLFQFIIFNSPWCYRIMFSAISWCSDVI